LFTRLNVARLVGVTLDRFPSNANSMS
jgi:hypothetical protein